MSLARIVGLVVLVVLLVAIISEPAGSAATARAGGQALGSAGSSLGEFVSSVSGGFSRPASSDDGDDDSSYTVRPGDTLSSIAARYSVSTATLAERNDLDDADLIRPGQRLSVR